MTLRSTLASAVIAGVLASASVVVIAEPAEAAPLEPCALYFDATPFTNLLDPAVDVGYTCMPQFSFSAATIEFRSVGGDLPDLGAPGTLAVSGGGLDRAAVLQYLGVALDDVSADEFDLPLHLSTRLDDGSDPRLQRWLVLVSLAVDSLEFSTGDDAPADLIETCASPFPATIAATWSFRSTIAALTVSGPDGPVEVQVELAPAPTQVLFALDPDTIDAGNPGGLEGLFCVVAEGQVTRQALADGSDGLGIVSVGLLSGAPFGFAPDGTSPVLDPVTFVLGDDTVTEEAPPPVDGGAAPTPAAAELPPTGAASSLPLALGAALALLVGVLAIASRRLVSQRASTGSESR